MAITLEGRAQMPGRIQLGARRYDEPELFAWAAVAAAWFALIAHEYLGQRHNHSLVGALPGWTVMTVAMMGPAVLPAVRHVAQSSLRWRRRQAIGEFAAVYVALWVGFGTVALTVASMMEPSADLLGGALLTAAAWQVSPHKRRALWDCHRAVPFPPRGIRATMGCARFGIVHGTACIRSCWLIMAAMAFTPRAHLVWASVFTTVILYERRARQPRHATRQSAIGLAALAVVLTVTGS